MGLIQEARIRATTIKLVPQLIRKTDEELMKILDDLKEKYKISEYDYTLMNVAIALMSEKEMLIKKGEGFTSPYILEVNDEQVQ